MDIAIVNIATAGDIIVDIRHPTEAELHPLKLAPENATTKVLLIPFYELRTCFSQLNQKQRFLLYCNKGMMSRLHAAHLQDEGLGNIAVFEPGTRLLVAK